MSPARGPRAGRTLLAISHPSVVSVNQEIYRELTHRGWRVELVVPRRWRHEYSPKPIAPRALAGLEATLRPVRVLFAGHPNRHVYLTSTRRVCAEAAPDVGFIECEAYSPSAVQWSRAFASLGIPFGVQQAANEDRSLQTFMRWARSRVLHEAAFVAARSQTAVQLARLWGASGAVELIPHAVPAWPKPAPVQKAHFTVGYAGRLVESKGLADLLAAVRLLDAPIALLLIGDGPMREQLEGQAIPGSKVRVLEVAHEEMPTAYAQLDLLVLPSRADAGGREQFGRVIPEALWCGIPVVGSDAGEIPWLIRQTQGGLLFPQGDTEALAERLRLLRDDPALRSELAAAGRRAVERLFSVGVAAGRLEHLLESSRHPAKSA